MDIVYKNIFIAIAVLLTGCASSNLVINKQSEIKHWIKIAIMPVTGMYGEMANRKLTYKLAGNIRYKTILPEYLTADVEKEMHKYRGKNANLSLNTVIAKKYNADAFLHTQLSITEELIGSKITVFVKIIDTKNNQIFAMSKNESVVYFNERKQVEELISRTLDEIIVALL